MARKIRHLVTIRIGMNKMAEGDEYLDYRDEPLERTAKPWSASLGVFFETKWRVLNALKLPHRTGRGRRVIRSRIHIGLVLSGVTTTRSEIEALIYMLASCLLCIAHKHTTNKEQR